MVKNIDFIIADNHFNHGNIIDYCNRDFSDVKEMDRFMVEMWNSIVAEGDTILHLGDFALGLNREDYKKLMNRLNGDIYLVRGNHDRMGRAKTLDIGFKEVCNKFEIDQFIFTHRPMKEVPKGKINIHGHVHNTKSMVWSKQHINVSAEVIGYKPMPFKEGIV